MTSIKSILCLIVVFVLPLCNSNCFRGYYWRDYINKEIPSDAYAGGHDIDRKPIYIGQSIVGDKILIAKIYAKNGKAYGGLNGKEYEAHDNLMILCSEERNKFEWVRTSVDDRNFWEIENLVRGGFVPGRKMFIGRTFHGSELTVGKVSTTLKGDVWGLYPNYNGTEYHYPGFEILTYNGYNY